MSKWKELQNEPEANAPEEGFQGLQEFEAAMQAETDDLARAFRERMQTENKRFFDVCNAHHYFTVCFSSEDQLMEFCEQFGLDPTYWFYDGREVAKKFNRALKTPDFENPRFGTPSKDYVKRARKIGD